MSANQEMWNDFATLKTYWLYQSTEIWSHWAKTGLTQHESWERCEVLLCKPPKSNSKWFISVSCQPYFRGPEVRGHQTYERTNLRPYLFSLLAITVANFPLHTLQLNGSQAIRFFNFQHPSRHGVKMTRNKLFCTASVFRWVHCPLAR